MRDYKLYLTDILESMESIEIFTNDLNDLESFKKDDKTLSAVIRKFEIIGEAAKNVPEDVKQKCPQIPWREMAGMRDKLIHVYFGIDYDLVWRSIKNRIPNVKPLVIKLIAELDVINEQMQGEKQ